MINIYDVRYMQINIYRHMQIKQNEAIETFFVAFSAFYMYSSVNNKLIRLCRQY